LKGAVHSFIFETLTCSVGEIKAGGATGTKAMPTTTARARMPRRVGNTRRLPRQSATDGQTDARAGRHQMVLAAGASVCRMRLAFSSSCRRHGIDVPTAR